MSATTPPSNLDTSNGEDTDADINVAYRDEICGEGVRFIGRMAHTMHSLRTYNLNSPAIRFGLRGMAAAAQAMFSMNGPTRIRIIGEQVSIGAFKINPPPGMVEAASRLRVWLRQRGVAAIEIVREPTAEEVKALFEVLDNLNPVEREIEEGEALEALEEAAVVAFQFISCDPSSEDDELLDEDPAVNAIRRYLRTARAVRRLHEQGPEPAVLLELTRTLQGLIDMILNDMVRVMALTQEQNVLSYDIRHPIHRAIFAMACGRRLGMQPKELLELGLCSMCVDLSLYFLPRSFLGQTSLLSQDEQKKLRQVPQDTVQLLLGAANLSFGLRRRLLVAFEFHLNTDRSGYPVPLSWPELHPFSRLLSVCDAFDAMVSRRSWRDALTPSDAMAQIRIHRGRRYDALMVDELDDLVSQYLAGGA